MKQTLKEAVIAEITNAEIETDGMRPKAREIFVVERYVKNICVELAPFKTINHAKAFKSRSGDIPSYGKQKIVKYIPEN